MRAKVRLEKIIKTTSGHEVVFTPVTAGGGENAQFFKYTPYGSITLGILNDAVMEKMEVGVEYYVDFSRAL